MTTREGAARFLEPSIVLVAGVALWFILVWLDRGASFLLGLAAPGLPFFGSAAPVFVEEGCKFLAALAFMRGSRGLSALRRRLDDGNSFDPEPGLRWPGLALATVVVFATAENLSYYIAFPGAGILWRLFWSLPIHLVGAMAVILGLVAGRISRILAALLFALSWHLAANAIAAAGPSTATLAAGSLANLLAIAALTRAWLQSVIVEGTLHGTTNRP